MTLEIYRITINFPNEEKFGIVSQMRRAAYSVSSNIVEGKSRNSQKEFYHFLSIARGSIDELGYFLLLSRDLNYIDRMNYENLSDQCAHIGSMLNNLMKKIKSSDK